MSKIQETVFGFIRNSPLPSICWDVVIVGLISLVILEGTITTLQVIVWLAKH